MILVDYQPISTGFARASIRLARGLGRLGECRPVFVHRLLLCAGSFIRPAHGSRPRPPSYARPAARFSGGPLTQELHQSGIYVSDMNSALSRCNNTIVRTNAVADLSSSGMIWAPLGQRWVEQVRHEMAAFPTGEFDDLHDAAVWGLLRLRNGNLIRWRAIRRTRSGNLDRRGSTIDVPHASFA